jgi:hypothetical protein
MVLFRYARKSLLHPCKYIRLTGCPCFDMAEVADEDPCHARTGDAGSSAVFCSVILLSLTSYNPEVEDP